MKYNEDFFIKRKKENDVLLHFLQECKFQGSFDTKVDLNVIIKVIAQSDFIIDNLRANAKDDENKIKELENKLKSFDGQPETSKAEQIA